jgi:type II secretory pathway component GspD/PulD (secretin)
VLVESGYRASIEAGQEVPVQNQTIVNNNTVVGIEYRTVGTTLKLTPHIIGPDHVELSVEPEVSSVTRFFDPGGSGLTNPLIQRQRANTRVILRSGETLEIGGLRSTRSLIQQTGIPLLMDIPIIGYLFRASRKELRRQDIVFFITPTIIDEIPDVSAPAYTQAITRDYESFFGGGAFDDPGGLAGTSPQEDAPRDNGNPDGNR